MENTWVDAVGLSVVASLAQQSSIKLTPRLLHFLQLFGDKVDAAARTRQAGNKKLSRALQELRLVNTVVREEVTTLRRTPPFRDSQDLLHLYARRHAETCLPIVHLALRGLPELILHVFRTYCNTRRGITYGLRLSNYCTGRLTGPVARAANYLRERCKDAFFQLSITDALTIWAHAALDIPLHERLACANAASPPPREPDAPRPPLPKRRRTPAPHVHVLDSDDDATPVAQQEEVLASGGGAPRPTEASAPPFDYADRAHVREEVVASGGGDGATRYAAEEIVASGGGGSFGSDVRRDEAVRYVEPVGSKFSPVGSKFSPVEEEVVATGGKISVRDSDIRTGDRVQRRKQRRSYRLDKRDASDRDDESAPAEGDGVEAPCSSPEAEAADADRGDPSVLYHFSAADFSNAEEEVVAVGGDGKAGTDKSAAIGQRVEEHPPYMYNAEDGSGGGGEQESRGNDDGPSVAQRNVSDQRKGSRSFRMERNGNSDVGKRQIEVSDGSRGGAQASSDMEVEEEQENSGDADVANKDGADQEEIVDLVDSEPQRKSKERFSSVEEDRPVAHGNRVDQVAYVARGKSRTPSRQASLEREDQGGITADYAQVKYISTDDSSDEEGTGIKGKKDGGDNW